MNAEQKNITLYGKEHIYAGRPLIALCYETDGYWSGRSNIRASNAGEAQINVTSMADGIRYMAEWSDDSQYICGYVADFENGVVYYDKQESLDHLARPLRNELQHLPTQILVTDWNNVPNVND